MIFFILLLNYINPPVFINGVYVSGTVFLLSFILFFLPYIFKYNLFTTQVLKYYCSLLLFLVTISFLALDSFKDNFLSLGQLLLGIFLFIFTVRYFSKKMTVSSIYLLYVFFLLFLVTGCLLEIYFGLSTVSDSFRHYLFSDTNFLYSSDLRDIEKTGFIRAKLFTSEPSHVLKMYIALSLGVLPFLNTSLKLFFWFLSALIFQYLFNSLSILVVVVVVTLFHYFGKYSRLKNSYLYFFIIVMSLATMLVSFIDVSDDLGVDLFSVSSENIRVVYPLLTLSDVLMDNPILGVGIGDKEKIFEISQITPYITNELLIEKGVAIGNNAFLRLFMYLGILGGGGFIFMFRKLLKAVVFNSSKNLNFIIFSILVFLTQVGSIVSIQTWFYITLICVPYAVQNKAYLRLQKFLY
jgi:hypothetical protein